MLKKEAMDLKEIEKGHIGRFEGRKVKGEMVELYYKLKKREK